MQQEELRVQYSDYFGRADRLREAIVTQLAELLHRDQITLGVPIQSRVKSWESIEKKLERNKLSLTSIKDLDDLIGLRLILLFRFNLADVEKLVRDTFDVIRSEDTAKRLGEAQFGYQSQHYVVVLPKSWLAIPTMGELGDLRVELQVRTLAQHIWAAASHVLQYKHEESVPPPIRRTIHRVSALLETVDLEFDRVFDERRDYRAAGIPAANESEPLNVDLLASLLNDGFPETNRDDHEPYAELLADMNKLSIGTVGELKTLLQKHYSAIMEREREELSLRTENEDYWDPAPERTKRGVFFTHVGLGRVALELKFGDKAKKVFTSRFVDNAE